MNSVASGWVIEHGPEDGPVYLTARFGWTRDRAKALFFARQVDAQDVVREQLGEDTWHWRISHAPLPCPRCSTNG